MTPRRPWKMILLSVIGLAMVAAIWLWQDAHKQPEASQWSMPETAPTGKPAQPPFPEPKKVLTPEEIRSGHWESEPPKPVDEAAKPEDK
ncbi:MAG: hypothetical protein ACREO1_09500 [Arenimonas sp.]